MRGELHRYETVPFPFDQALDLGLELAGIVGGPIGRAFKGLLTGGSLSDDDLDEQMLGAAAGEIGELPAKLLAAGGSRLVARILARTTRIGRHQAKPGVPAELYKMPLADPQQRDAAFGGGNLAEAMKAVKWVLQVNYGPFLTDLWQSLRGPLAGLVTLPTSSATPESSEGPTIEQQSDGMKPTEIV
jgi:hypothetical protein